MSDPFTALRRTRDRSGAPPLDAIKARAARIERRRHIALGSGAGIIAIVGLVSLFAGAGPRLTPDAPRRLAQGAEYVPTPEIFEHTAEPTAEGEGTATEKNLAQPDAAPQGAAALAAPSEGDESASQEGAAETEAPAAARRSGDIHVDLDVNEEALGPARRIGFTLTACNKSEEPVERDFPSSQRYDFEVQKDGKFVWRWSDGRAFAQVFTTERWEPGECKSYTDYWSGRYPDGSRAESGQYEATGTLTSDPQLKADPETFCLDTC